jgi:hypothetical protein
MNVIVSISTMATYLLEANTIVSMKVDFRTRSISYPVFGRKLYRRTLVYGPYIKALPTLYTCSCHLALNTDKRV